VPRGFCGYLAGMTARRASAVALGFSMAGVVLTLLLVTMAARTGPHGVIRGASHDSIFHAPTPKVSQTPSSSGPPLRSLSSYHGSPKYSWLPLVGDVIKVAVVGYLLLLAWRGARWLLEELASRRRREAKPLRVDFDVLDDPEPLIDEMRRDADSQYELLLVGTPRNAIVACWDRFEEQAERVGAARKPWETSSEFTMRLLDAVSADLEAVTGLEHLYREARFSDHEITEANRQAALGSLQTIHASIGAAVGSSR
jgi:hypothetical protein